MTLFYSMDPSQNLFDFVSKNSVVGVNVLWPAIYTWIVPWRMPSTHCQLPSSSLSDWDDAIMAVYSGSLGAYGGLLNQLNDGMADKYCQWFGGCASKTSGWHEPSWIKRFFGKWELGNQHRALNECNSITPMNRQQQNPHPAIAAQTIIPWSICMIPPFIPQSTNPKMVPCPTKIGTGR